MRNRLTSTLSVLGLAVTLAACGEDSGQKARDAFTALSVADIEAQAIADMGSLTSLHLEGAVSVSEGDIGLNMDVSTSGDCSGTLTIKGGTAQILSVDAAAYLKGDEKFWKATAGTDADAVIALIGDKWVKSGSNDQLTQLCDLDRILESLDKDNGTEDAKGDIAEVNGLQAIEITTKQDGGTTHAWVALDGKHYVLKVESEGGTEPGTLTFSDFNKELKLTAPADEEVIDFGQ